MIFSTTQKSVAQKISLYKWDFTAKRTATNKTAVLSNRFNVVVRYEHEQGNDSV